MGRWYRSRSDRVLAGVSGAVSRWSGLPLILVRVLFVLLALVHGFGALLYLAGTLLIPDEESQAENFGQVLRDNVLGLVSLATELWWMLVDWWRGWRERRTWGNARERSREILGLALVIGASLAFLSTFGLLGWLTFGRFLALCVLALGVYLLVRGRSSSS